MKKVQVSTTIGAIMIAAAAYCIIGAPSASAEGITWADTSASSTTRTVTTPVTETSAPDYVPDDTTTGTATPPPESPDQGVPDDTLAMTGVMITPMVLGGLLLLTLGLVTILRKRLSS